MTNYERNDLFTTIGVRSYGTITFRVNSSNRANFIRIPPDASPVLVKDLFFRKYQHTRPSLVISIEGSAREYNVRSKLFRTLRQGLLKVAKTTDVSMITYGINTSMTKLLGEIIRTNPDPSRPIHLIGMAPWGCISGVEQLDVHGTNVIYTKGKSDQNHQTSLEPNHTDFIFIDDGSVNEYGTERQYRRQFERAICGEFASFQSNRQLDSTPIVLLVIDGGHETIRKVHESVVENRIPVVLVEGTGGCCDLFAKCCQLYNDYHSKTKSSDKQIKAKLREKFQILVEKLHSTPNESDSFELIYECLLTRNRFLNFIDLKPHNHLETELDLAILQALLNMTTQSDRSEMTIDQKREQIHLAFEWKRIDLMKNLILKDDYDWKTMDLNDLFEKSLRDNQLTFVQLFLDQDFPLNDFFEDHQKLLSLYRMEKFQLIHEIDDPLRGIYMEIIQPLIGDFFQVNAIFQLEEIDVEKELFLWAVLTGKQELALIFWARGKNKVCAALIATLIYKSKARKEKDPHYIEYADEFQTLAVQILEKFYQTNPFECTQAIIRQIPQFGNVTWLHLAVMAEAKLFIAERGVQSVLSDIWYGYIDHRVGNRVIFLTSLFIWYGGFLPYHEELVEGNEKSNKVDEESDWVLKRYLSRSRSSIDFPDPASSKLMKDIVYDPENSTSTRQTKPWKKMKSGVKQYLKNLSMFVDAPCVKYLYNLYSHVIFLMLFSYVILCDFFPLYASQCILSTEEQHGTNDRSVLNATESFKYGLQQHDRPATTELILAVWIFILFCEEIRQVIAMEVQSISGKILSYFAVFWNQLDVLALALFFIAFILRLLPLNHSFCAARILLAVDLSIWYIRTLDMFSAIKRLGPKLVMIGEMVHDLKFYMIMLTVFILAYGVPAYSLIYGVQRFSWHIPREILNLAYWQIFGELEVLDEIEKNYEISGYVVFILLIAYMTLASVLLINLLIAMFSNTFDRLQADTDCIWKFQHYSLVCYHLTRPSLPPPLVIFSHIYQMMIYVFSHWIRIEWFYQKYLKHESRSKFKIVADEMLSKKIEGIEDALGNEVYFFSLKTDRKQIDRQNDFNEERVHSPQEIVLNKIKILENQIQSIQNQQSNIFEYLEYLMNGIKKIGGDDIEVPKRIHQDADLF